MCISSPKIIRIVMGKINQIAERIDIVSDFDHVNPFTFFLFLSVCARNNSDVLIDFLLRLELLLLLLLILTIFVVGVFVTPAPARDRGRWNTRPPK